MIYNFYKINSKESNQLKELINNYNNIIEDILIGKSQSLDLFSQKDGVEEEIFKILTQEKIIGSLSEEEYDNIEKNLRNKYFGNNIIDSKNIEEFIFEEDSNIIKKIKHIFKKSLVDNSVICFWIG